VAKRTRANRSAHRPGGQGPNRAKKSSGVEAESSEAQDPATSAAEDVGADYSEIEGDETAVAAVAATATPEATETKGTRRQRRARRRTGKKSQDDLASRAAAENVWVREDLRRIGVVSVILVAALAVAWVVFGVMDVLNLY
jgi:hypothetical protein